MYKSFRDLQIYQKSYQLALKMHKISMSLPQPMQFDLADQTRRASRSVPTNIAEGFGKRKSNKEFARYIQIAIGSKDEMLVHLDFLKNLGFIKQEAFEQLQNEYDELGKMMFGFLQHLTKNI